MATYNTGVTRTAGTDPNVPEPVVLQMIKELPQQSSVLSVADRVIPMSSLTTRQPVLASKPIAYFVNGDQGLKQTTDEQWKNVVLHAEEIAALVPVPNNYIDDSGIPVWDEIRPEMVEAVGLAFDQACLFAVNKPASWTSLSIYDHAVAAGNVIDATNDPGRDVTGLGLALAKDGFRSSAFLCTPGFDWQLAAYRSPQGLPIYVPDTTGAPGGKLYGRQLNEVANGAWDDSKAELIALDGRKIAVGLRKDVTFDMSDSATIVDDNGKVIMSAFQQDTTIMRITFRAAYAVANPVTRLNSDEGTRSPFAVLRPAHPAS